MMKKFLKLIVIFSLIVSVFGCSTNKNNSQEQNDSQEKIKIDVFVLSTCSNCQAFKDNAIPALEKEFGDRLELNLYDIDIEENGKLYDEVTAKLEGYDQEYSRRVPFIVVPDYFAVLAYNKGEEVALISDIKNAYEGKPLGTTLEEGRWLFK